MPELNTFMIIYVNLPYKRVDKRRVYATLIMKYTLHEVCMLKGGGAMSAARKGRESQELCNAEL